jgi:hypothetical membrane protein
MEEARHGPTPLVHRAVRSGGILIAIASIQFVAAMIVVQSRYPGYSLTGNYISDLGGAHSPWALLFDASVIALGAIAFPSLLLVWSSFDAHPARAPGLLLLLIASAGAIGVGVFPETTHLLHGNAHDYATYVAFVGAALGFLVLSFAMRRPERWRFSGPYTLATGAVSIAATILLSFSVYLGIGPGGMERLIVAPILLWMVAEGLHISWLHRFAPGLLIHGTST